MGTGNGATAVADKNLVTIGADAGVISDEAMWKLIADGDLGKLTDRQKSNYYLHLCQSVGLNPATQPFRYMVLNGKLTLYAQKNATDQLRAIHGVDIARMDRGIEDDLYIVTVAVRDKTGRVDEDMGAVPISGLTGDAKVNAMLKAVTKAKRRATLSICGLGFLDETEVESVAQASVVPMRAGEVVPDLRATTATVVEAAPARHPTDARAPSAGEAATGDPDDIPDAAFRDATPAIDSWNTFWPWARSQGLTDTYAVEALIGRASNGLSPADLVSLIEAARSGTATPGEPGEPLLTDAQNRKLHARGAELFGREAHEILHALAEVTYGIDSVAKLTVTAASHLIDRIEQPGVNVQGIREYVASARRQQAIDRGQQGMPIGQSPEIAPTEAALIAFRERAEASDDWEADAIYSEAGDSPERWLELVKASPAASALNRVTGHIKRKGLFTPGMSEAVSKRQRELRARADALTR